VKSISLKFDTREQFCSEIKSKELSKLDSDSLLIQVFSGICSVDELEDIRKVLNYHFTRAKIIGTTTDGEIIDGRATTEKIVITIQA